MPCHIPKLCRHRASNQGYVTDPATRREVYLGPWGAAETQAAYGCWVTAFLARGQAGSGSKGTSANGEALTLAGLWVAFARYAEVEYRKAGRATSEIGIIKRAASYCQQMFPTLLAEELTPVKLKELRASMIADDLARSTVNQYVRRIRRAYRWAVGESLVSAAVLVGLEAVPDLRKGRGGVRDNPPVLPVALAVVEATLPHLRPHWRAVVRVQLVGGMRPGEVLCMRPEDIDRSSEPWLYTPWTWKTEHHEDPARRRIWLGPSARDVLQPLLDQAKRPDAWLWRGNKGGHLTVAAYDVAVRTACERHGIEAWTPNQLRHTRATQIRQLYGLEAAQAALGHEELSTTQIYAARLDELARKVAEEMPGLNG